MTGIISGIQKYGRMVSFVVLLDDCDGGLIEMPSGDFFNMVRKANKIYSDITDFNGTKCKVNLYANNRLIRVTGIR